MSEQRQQRPDWLYRQFQEAIDEVRRWPKWMRDAAGVVLPPKPKKTKEKPACPTP